MTVADQRGVALRGGHHCNQPLMHKLGVESTARASFYFYNTHEEIDRFVEVLGEIQRFFGRHDWFALYDRLGIEHARGARSLSRRPTSPVPPLPYRRLQQLRVFDRTRRWQQLCQRYGELKVEEVLEHIQASHNADAKVLIATQALASWRKEDPSIRLLDVRSREEFEAVHIDGSVLLSQPVMQQIMAEGTNTRPVVIIDHQGKQGLDAAAYFMGHGLQNVRCLRGGIDAWSREVDASLRRYAI